jgi:hypothetical protein
MTIGSFEAARDHVREQIFNDLGVSTIRIDITTRTAAGIEPVKSANHGGGVGIQGCVVDPGGDHPSNVEIHAHELDVPLTFAITAHIADLRRPGPGDRISGKFDTSLT